MLGVHGKPENPRLTEKKIQELKDAKHALGVRQVVVELDERAANLPNELADQVERMFPK